MVAAGIAGLHAASQNRVLAQRGKDLARHEGVEMLDATFCIMILPSYLYPFGMTARQADQDFGRSIADIERA